MQKVGRLVGLLLIGLLLIPAFLLSGGADLLGWMMPPVVEAAGKQIHQRTSNCEDWHPSIGNTVVVKSDEAVCGGLTSFGGTDEILGEVQGSVFAFNSNVMIFGTVNGNVNAYGGTVTIEDSAHINGDIHLYGAKLGAGTSTQFKEKTFNHIQYIQGLRNIDDEFSFPFWPILTWIAIGILVVSLFPEHAMFVRTTVANRARRSFFIGLLSILLAPVVVLVLVALIVTIPLAIIVILALIAAWALGMVAAGWCIGQRILQKVVPHQNHTRTIQVAIGLTVLVLVGSVPYIGWLITIGAGLLGLGAVFLSRFGTQIYGQPRQPLTL
jgi:hypothetical protein